MFALLKELVEIESPSGDTEGIERCCQTIVSVMKEIPANTKRIETELGPVIKIEITPGSSRNDKNILILAHMDTKSEAFILARSVLVGEDEYGMEYIAASRENRI